MTAEAVCISMYLDAQLIYGSLIWLFDFLNVFQTTTAALRFEEQYNSDQIVKSK